MNLETLIEKVRGLAPGLEVSDRGDELYFRVAPAELRPVCLRLHQELAAPVSLMFATDDRAANAGFGIWCGFRANGHKKWIFARAAVTPGEPRFDSLSSDVHSASFFEREIKEMFGIEPLGAPDTRRLKLHDEVWPEGFYPLRKDFIAPPTGDTGLPQYRFARGEGEGIFEVPVGPVHAGIIGPGHFRFSVAGEPIINLEIRLGFSHRGAEKLFEGKKEDAARLAERVSGDSSFAHGLAFCRAIEKINGVVPPPRAVWLRAIFLELERLYNHAADMGGMALDVGFSLPATHASALKESIQRVNQLLTGSRFLKNVVTPGGMLGDIDEGKRHVFLAALPGFREDFDLLRSMLMESVSFMDRVDSTGILKRKTAHDLGIAGLSARASGIQQDLRKDFGGTPYEQARFKAAFEQSGDVLARLRVRFSEFEESLRLLREFAELLPTGDSRGVDLRCRAGYALGYAEGWRGPVLYWVRADGSGAVERCKIVDPSFLNWQGMAYCVLGDIIPDFPLCNKSFDLSYSGNDL